METPQVVLPKDRRFVMTVELKPAQTWLEQHIYGDDDGHGKGKTLKHVQYNRCEVARRLVSSYTQLTITHSGAILFVHRNRPQ